MLKKICIIPARGGSKRIPRKNIKNFLGKPILAYSITAALESALFQEVMVSTDDLEIADIAVRYGASVPFMRSAVNSDDFSTTADVLLEVLETYQGQGWNFDLACCLYPAAPFVSAKLLQEACAKILEGDYDCVFPVLPFSYPTQRALCLNQYGIIRMLYPEFQSVRSQDLEKSYHDSGQFYFLRPPSLFNHKKIFTNHTAALLLNEMQAHDIDTEEDWAVAEFKYKFLASRQ